MSDTIFDLLELSKKYDIPVEYHTLPNGRVIGHAHWDVSAWRRLSDELAQVKPEPGHEYMITNSPEPWITVAAIRQLGAGTLKYLYPDPNGRVLRLPELPKSQTLPADNHDLQLQLIEDGDSLYINMTSDRPEARDIGHHTFDVDDLPRLVLPEIPKGKRVYIHAWGMYCVMATVALSYIPDSKALFIACHDSDYVCAYSAVDGVSIGDVAKRTLDNPLPH